MQWQAERESGRDDRYRAVWVANHPPLHYVVTAPLIWFSDATDRPDGGLMLMRLANIAFAAAGVVFTYLLARDLSGGGRRIGVAAAAIAALVPQGTVLFSEAMNDGLGFAAATAVVWAGVRCIGTPSGRWERGDLVALGVAAAACAGARSATLLVAVVVVLWVAVARFRHRAEHGRQSVGFGINGRRLRTRPRCRRCSGGTTSATTSCTATSPDPSSFSTGSGGSRVVRCSTCSRGATCGSTSTTC